MSSRQEIVCTFLALLELIRIRQVDVVQKDRFGDITIETAEAEETEASEWQDGESELELELELEQKHR